MRLAVQHFPTVQRPTGVLTIWRGAPDNVEVRVHDSTADLRYMVLPRRPGGTEGWGEEELRELVTRDSMIGVRLPHDGR